MDSIGDMLRVIKTRLIEGLICEIGTSTKSNRILQLNLSFIQQDKNKLFIKSVVYM